MQSMAQQTDLGHPFWANEAASLDVDCTRVRKAIDELNLERQGYDALFVLETVPRADLDQVHGSRMGGICPCEGCPGHADADEHGQDKGCSAHRSCIRSLMASLVAILDLKGKPLIQRSYRDDVPPANVERFLPLVLDIEEDGQQVTPCISSQGIHYMHIRHSNLYSKSDRPHSYLRLRLSSPRPLQAQL